MKKSVLCAAIACAAFLNTAQAAPIVFNWQGTATVAMSNYGIEVGDPYQGTVSFDPTTARVTRSWYTEYNWWSGTPMSVSVKAGTLDRTVDVETFIANNYYGSIDDIEFYSNSTDLGYFNLQLQDGTGKAMDSLALPTESLDYSAFPVHRLFIHGDIVADITSFTVASDAAAVPEPATMGLLGLGLAAVGLARRRKQGAAR